MGVQQWVQRYNGPANSYDQAKSLKSDDSGNVYVTGWTYVSTDNYDYATVKYSSSGIQQWVQFYNGPGNSYDFANSIAVDGFGNAYVTGSSGEFSLYIKDYATVKYSSAGVQLWVQRYGDTGNVADEAFSIVVDNSGNVYVTGYGSAYVDYVTIKYSQTTGIKTISGEIPQEYKLYQNYPNPFNPTTRIKFDIQQNVIPNQVGNPVKLIIYDILGREITTLVNEELKAGNYEVVWDGTYHPTGMYFYKLQTENFAETKKFILLK